jgi:phosphoribosylformimino-5-aminoimidazole carboxamide ribotide isomerase
MLQGPDVDGLAAAARRHVRIPVIASGGVATLADVVELGRVPGIAGVITGKALYEGRFTVADGVSALQEGSNGGVPA